MKKFLIIVLCLLLCGCSITINFGSDKEESKETETIETVRKESLIDNKKVSSDSELVEYIDNTYSRVNELVSKKKVSEKDEHLLRNTFITLTDFIFYGGEIKGKTFSELKDDIKEKILDIYTKIDSKIEDKVPNYKEDLKEGALDIKDMVNDLKNSILNKYKNYTGEEDYNEEVESFKEGINDMKEVYDTYKPYIDSGKEKAKEYYESGKEYLNDWYQKYKER